MGEKQDKASLTAQGLYDNVLAIVGNGKLTMALRLKLLHETLVVTCAEALKDTRYGFGDLNSQLESVMRLFNIHGDEANALRQARRDSNRSHINGGKDEASNILLYDAAAVARLISRVLKTAMPGTLTPLLPRDIKPAAERLRHNSPDKRCIVRSFDEETIRVVVDEDGGGKEMTVYYTRQTQYAHMEYLHGILKPGMHLNLLDCQTDGDTITPRLIIVEPDCLMDISVIASCFEDYGHHPLMYLLSRIKERANTQAILLGNYAGACLDDIINAEEFSATNTLIKNFRDKALEYASCTDFDGAKFKADAARQARNLTSIVDELRRHYDMKKAILEPTFVCEKLGLQGRVDLMTTDLQLLVEQKSGRNIFLERGTANSQGAKVVEKHYVQVLLYFGILYYNFGVQHSDIRLLYSKYPLPDGLIGVTSLMKLVYEALRFRNEAIALEFDIAENGMENILPQITEQTLNVAHAGGHFYDTYLRPQLLSLIMPLHTLTPLEHDYFCRMTQFVIRENIMSRVGVVEGTGNCMANLWNMPLAEKKETGNIFTGLTSPREVDSKGQDAEECQGGVCDTLAFSVPDQGEDFLPNFRRGDMIYLYAYDNDAEPDARKAILLKGGIQQLHTDSVVVKLMNPLEKNYLSQNKDKVWCIEHGSSDVGGGAALSSIYQLVTAPRDRRDLLLGQRAPQTDKSITLSRNYNGGIDDIILKAKQARDYFLLVGPPGTGKTSMALQFMVREALAELNQEDGKGLLLMAYTNRAVDEICGMLADNGIDFLRVGSELACAESFTPYLLQNRVGEKPTLAGMKQLIGNAKVIVGTTSMIQSRAYIFSIKHFALAIVDEASQILEPNIIGLLASHRATGTLGECQCNIERFILIGDYKQLPAVVQQSDSDSTVRSQLLLDIGLTDCKNSLFERLIRQELLAHRTDFIGTLRRQGRMHPDIAEFPNREFYSRERLSCVPLPHQEATEIGYTMPSGDGIDDLLKSHRMIFFASRDCRQPEISDKVNADEAQLVSDLLKRIYRFYGERFNADKTVGVIVPYRNQIAMIRKEIEKTGIKALDGISIDTVERYQGSQRDVIIYSFTIQQAHQLDFLTANTFTEDGHEIDRKLNVALTRARKQLILTGNVRTLSASPLFRQLMDYIKKKGGMVER